MRLAIYISPASTPPVDSWLTIEIICGKCGATLYSGIDLKSPREVLKMMNGRCRKCGAQLSDQDPTVEVTSMYP